MFAAGPQPRTEQKVEPMSAPELALAIFTMMNSARVLAYFPQFMRILHYREGAHAISCTTWLLFALSHLSTVIYAIFAVYDLRMAAIFTANLLCCLLVLGVTVYKRAQGASGHLFIRPTA